MRRTEANKDKIYVARANNIEFSITLGDARERFRARAFEQKGFSSTMIAGAGDQITGIAAAEEIDRRHRIESNISAGKARVNHRAPADRLLLDKEASAPRKPHRISSTSMRNW